MSVFCLKIALATPETENLCLFSVKNEYLSEVK